MVRVSAARFVVGRRPGVRIAPAPSTVRSASATVIVATVVPVRMAIIGLTITAPVISTPFIYRTPIIRAKILIGIVVAGRLAIILELEGSDPIVIILSTFGWGD